MRLDSKSLLNDLPEPDLLELLRRGSRAAGNELCRRVTGTVEFTVSKLVSSADPDYADACQGALEQVVRTVTDGRFEGRCSVLTWARAIARNVSLFTVRERLRERQLVASTSSGELPEPWFASSQGEDIAVARCDVARTRQFLSGIRRERAKVLWLHHAWGYDLSEIADTLGISTAAAQSRLVRGRRELQGQVDSMNAT
jgi:RNA polymerase sigma factor (sigma-70 family)